MCASVCVRVCGEEAVRGVCKEECVCVCVRRSESVCACVRNVCVHMCGV